MACPSKTPGKDSTAPLGSKARLWLPAEKRDSPRLKGVLPKDYARPGLAKHRLGEWIDLIGTIVLLRLSSSEETARADLPLDAGAGVAHGAVEPPSLTRFASAEGKKGASTARPSASFAASSRCSSPTRAASTIQVAAPAACSPSCATRCCRSFCAGA